MSMPLEPPPSPVVQITLGDVYAEVRGLHDGIRELAAKLDPLRDASRDHEQRIRALERRSFMYAGGAGVAGAALSSFVTVMLIHR